MVILLLSLVAQKVKSLPAMQKTWVQSLGQEDPLEKGMATHSSIIAWEIPWTEESGKLQSIGCGESDTTEQLTLSLFFVYKSELISRGTSLVVQRLRLCTSIPGGATKIPYATQHSQKKKY